MLPVEIRDWETLETHPACELFPPMNESEFASLKADIELGFDLTHPIVLYHGQILDGKNRWNVCKLLKEEGQLKDAPVFVEWDEPGDPLDWVVRTNLNRRHLSEGQRAMVAAKISTMKRGDNQHTQICGTSQSEAAAMLNVSARSVSAAVAITKADPQLARAVETGERKLFSAEKAIRSHDTKKHGNSGFTGLVTVRKSPVISKAEPKQPNDRLRLQSPNAKSDIESSVPTCQTLQFSKNGGLTTETIGETITINREVENAALQLAYHFDRNGIEGLLRNLLHYLAPETADYVIAIYSKRSTVDESIRPT
jgi:hypothetical protein